MTGAQRPGVISGFIAHHEFVDQFQPGAPHVSKCIDPRRNLTSFNRVSAIIAHRHYDVKSGYRTSRWLRIIKPRHISFINDRDVNFL